MADQVDENEFEDVLKMTGDFGKYQKRLFFFFLVPSAALIPWFSANTIFMVYTPDHWCYVPDIADSNLTVAEQRTLIAPKGRGSCFMYALNYTEILHTGNFQVPNDTKVIPCNKGWQYDTTYFSETATTKWNMVCNDGSYPSLVLALGYVGSILLTPIYGHLSDRIGRKPVFFMILIIFIISSVASILVNNLVAFMVMRTISGSNMPCLFQMTFITILELVGMSSRMWINFLINLFWGIGLCILPLVAYLSRNWVTLGWVNAAAAALLLGYWRFLPESPQWLITKGKFVEAEVILLKIAQTNRKTLADLRMKIQILAEKTQKAKTSAEMKNSPVDLCRYPNVRKKFLIISFCWVADALSYNGLQLTSQALFGNPFVNFFLLALVEEPGYVVGWLVMAKIGRRFCSVSALLLSGIACLGAAVVPQDVSYGAVIFCMIAKFGATAAFMVVYLQSSELYPTTLRAFGMGMSGICGGLANVIVPYIVFLTAYGKYIPFLIIAIVSLAAGISAGFLPETLNAILPQTVSDAENFGKNQRCFSVRWKKRSQTEESSKLLRDET